MRKLFLLIAMFACLTPARPDEGMWLPLLVNRLNYADMQKMGLKLTAEEIYSVNNSSLKDAIVIYGRGCTAEIISPEGLLLTNHHCGYGAIQSLSTTTNDYLTDGFWAMNRNEELPNPGLTVRFLQYITDVTAKVMEVANGAATEADRIKAVEKISASLAREATEGTGFEAVVKDFFDGNAYYLFVYEVYSDVRLVGAPPSSIGKFGADTDNWMWPRHTGDFSLFRVYTGPDGKPAPYSKDNIPLKPKHYLPISIAGIQEGDFAMIMGYPGTTDRYLTSYGIELSLNSTYPTRIDIRRKKLDIMMEDMQADAAVRIKYSSKYAGVANYWKNFIGMSKALKKLNVADRKEDLEAKLAKWITADRKRAVLYGSVLPEMEKAYREMAEFNVARFYYIEAIRSGSELLNLSAGLSQWVNYLKGKEITQEKTDATLKRYETTLNAIFKDLNVPTDQKLLAAMLEMYFKNVPAHQQPELLKKMASKYKGDFAKYAAKIFKKTLFTSKEKLLAALKTQNPAVIEKDPLYQLAMAFVTTMEPINKKVEEINLSLARNKRLFMAALTEMESDKVFYPNANSTMRLTYGAVKGYKPADAVEYTYLTTMDGVMEKEDSSNWEFVVPEKLKRLYEAKDFGPYGINGKMPVAFLTTHDITGGNSGSPVINAYGELIGTAFDGNWEAMSGDIHFEKDLQRTISVDIRYVLFIIEKYGNAGHLIREMEINGARQMNYVHPEGIPTE